MSILEKIRNKIRRVKVEYSCWKTRRYVKSDIGRLEIKLHNFYSLQMNQQERMHKDMEAFHVKQYEELNSRLSHLVDRTSNDYFELDKRILNFDQRISNHLEVLEKELNERHVVVKQELEGIRSRYHWVEERYDEITKDKKPREFNFNSRQ